MKNLLLILTSLAITSSCATSQDEPAESRLPQSKQAMLTVDVSLEKVMADKVYGPLLMQSGLLQEFVPPSLGEAYSNISRVTVFVGIPNTRFGEPDFIVRVKAKEKSAITKLTKAMFGGVALETRQEDGWTVSTSSPVGDQGVIRWKDDLLEFGSTLYTYTPTSKITSNVLAASFSAMDKDAAIRIACDARALNIFFTGIVALEQAEEETVYQMITRGEFFSENSFSLYCLEALREIQSANLAVNFESDSMVQLSLTPFSGKKESVAAKAKVLHDFLTFHVKLPAKVLKEKDNPVAGILEKIAAGINFSQSATRVQLSMEKPKNLSKDILAITEKMRGSFASREDGNHFKRVGLAIHNYHDVYRRWPFAEPVKGDQFSKDLSWRVRLMPYMEHHPEYERMDISKGWQAPANQAAIKNCRDSYVISTGGLVCTIKTEHDVKSFRSITDGTSNTIMLIENRKASMTPWTKPLDLDIDEAVKLVTSLQKGDFLWIGMYDGSVHKLRSIKETDITEKEIRCLFDPRDGNPLDLERIFDRHGSQVFPEVGRLRFEKIEVPASPRIAIEADPRKDEDDN